MKLTILLLTVAFLQLRAKSDAQQITLHRDNISLASVLEQIYAQTGYQFVSTKDILKDARRVSLNVKDAPLQQVLDSVFKDQLLTYTLRNGAIIIKRKEKRHIEQEQVLPPIDISGRVTDSLGNPLIGVTILIKGTKTGTSTDLKGNYKLSAPSGGDTLVFSYIGFQEKIIPIKNRRVINVQMQSVAVTGKTVIVTAFGEHKASEDVVGAVTSLSQEQIARLQSAPTANLTTSLAGRIPGLIAFQRSGEPGADNAQFFVRGVTTFGYNKDPLILIDGVQSSVNQLARLNPDNIQSFSILKDATATSLYGSEAANGVLIITTKVGHEGPLQVHFRIENDISKPTQVPKLADPITYMKDKNEATVTRIPLATLPYSLTKIENTQSGKNPYLYPAVDWYGELFKDQTMNHRFNLDASGGGKFAQYYLSGSYYQSNGLLRVPKLNDFNNNISLKTYTMRSNINAHLTKTTSVALKFSGIIDAYQGPLDGGAEVYNQVIHSSPVNFPPYFPTDSVTSRLGYTLYGGYNPNPLGTGTIYINPYAEMTKGYKTYDRSNIDLQFRLKQDLSMVTKGLNISGLFYIERYSYASKSRAFSPYYYQAIPTSVAEQKPYLLVGLNPLDGNNHLSPSGDSTVVTADYKYRIKASYDRVFDGDHGVSGLLVFMARNETNQNVTDLQASLPHRNVSVASRLTYNYRHKYYLEFNFGANASERFAKKHRWGFFPSYGAAWNVSNEKFWEPVRSVIDRFKIRATYGFSGNDNIGDQNHRFAYLSQVDLNSSSHHYTTGLERSFNTGGVVVNRYANPSIIWERSQKTNLGVDLDLFRSLHIEANFFTEDRTNIAQSRVDLPASMGLEDIPRLNYGEVKVKGFDSHVTYQFTTDNWRFQFRGNFTYGENKIIKYSEKSYPGEPWKSQIGFPTGTLRGYIAERLFIDDNEVHNSPTQNFGGIVQAGDIKYRDLNNDGVINSLDEVPMGFPSSPQINYGFGFSAAYKGFGVDLFCEGLARESFFIDAAKTAPFVNADGNTQLLQVYADDHWSTDNGNLKALYPRFSVNQGGSPGYDNNIQPSTWWLRDGSFLRIKEIQLSYSLPADLISKIKLKELQVYINGLNLACFSHFKLWDPEMGGNGLGYPIQQTYNIGFNVRF